MDALIVACVILIAILGGFLLSLVDYAFPFPEAPPPGLTAGTPLHHRRCLNASTRGNQPTGGGTIRRQLVVRLWSSGSIGRAP